MISSVYHLSRLLITTLLMLVSFSVILPQPVQAVDVGSDITTGIGGEAAGLPGVRCNDPFALLQALSRQASDNPVTKVSTGLSLVECTAFAVISLGFNIGLIIAAILVAIGGIQYQLAQGNPKTVEQAVKRMQNALIGFALLFLLSTALNLFLNFVEYRAGGQTFNIPQSGTTGLTPSAQGQPTVTGGGSGTGGTHVN